MYNKLKLLLYLVHNGSTTQGTTLTPTPDSKAITQNYVKYLNKSLPIDLSFTFANIKRLTVYCYGVV